MGKYPKIATPQSEEEFIAAVRKALSGDFKTWAGDDDYSKAAQKLTVLAVLGFQYAAHVVGATVFQASCTDLAFLGIVRMMDQPFAIIHAGEMLYPQYNIHARVEGYLEGWKSWAAEEARKKLAENHEYAAERVVAHWKLLVEEELEGVASAEGQEGARNV